MCHRSKLHLLFAVEIFGGDFPSELLLDPDELDPEELLLEEEPELESGSGVVSNSGVERFLS